MRGERLILPTRGIPREVRPPAQSTSPTGYLDPLYAASFGEFGHVRWLKRCGGWILERDIDGTGYRDVTGLYPRFFCRDWTRLPEDLEAIRKAMVTVTLVTNPFAPHDTSLLHRCFDRVRPYKEHFIVDLMKPIERIGTRRHRKYARYGFKKVRIEICRDPASMLEQWLTLYAHLIARHDIRGIQRFSPTAFEKQLQATGTMMLKATLDGRPVGCHTYIVMGDIVYAHLAAMAPESYEVHASYALHRFAIKHYLGIKRWLDLGAGAGIESYGTDGLSQYKRGWASHTRPVYLCGRTFDHEIYNALCGTHNARETDFFPYYRKHRAA